MRTVGVVTVARSDFGCYLPVLQAIRAHPDLDVHLIVTGSHLSPEFGLTVSDIEREGLEVGERVETLLSSDTPEGTAKSLALGVIGCAESFARRRPDVLLVLGDRFEMLAAVVAALPATIPVAHIHGGESTEGAIDESMRHAITKLSHLHFAAAKEYAERIIQMGEEPWRVTVSGAPGLDNLRTSKVMDLIELEARLGLELPSRFILVTYHPVTLQQAETAKHVTELLEALDRSSLPMIITYPNPDPGGRIIIGMIDDFAARTDRAMIVPSLGSRAYWSLMALATAMVGNSSSGIIEAPSLELPVVNVGARQRGRIRAANVIDAGDGRDEIHAAIERATAPAFRASLEGLTNPYGDGHAAERIVGVLAEVELGERLLVKRFHERPSVFT